MEFKQVFERITIYNRTKNLKLFLANLDKQAGSNPNKYLKKMLKIQQPASNFKNNYIVYDSYRL